MPPGVIAANALLQRGDLDGALAAFKALLENTELPARHIVEKALKIAGDICIYTNHQTTLEELS